MQETVAHYVNLNSYLTTVANFIGNDKVAAFYIKKILPKWNQMENIL